MTPTFPSIDDVILDDPPSLFKKYFWPNLQNSRRQSCGLVKMEPPLVCATVGHSSQINQVQWQVKEQHVRHNRWSRRVANDGHGTGRCTRKSGATESDNATVKPSWEHRIGRLTRFSAIAEVYGFAYLIGLQHEKIENRTGGEQVDCCKCPGRNGNLLCYFFPFLVVWRWRERSFIPHQRVTCIIHRWSQP